MCMCVCWFELFIWQNIRRRGCRKWRWWQHKHLSHEIRTCGKGAGIHKASLANTTRTRFGAIDRSEEAAGEEIGRCLRRSGGAATSCWPVEAQTSEVIVGNERFENVAGRTKWTKQFAGEATAQIRCRMSCVAGCIAARTVGKRSAGPWERCAHCGEIQFGTIVGGEYSSNFHVKSGRCAQYNGTTPFIWRLR